MGRIKTLSPLIPKADGRTVRLEPKQVDQHYLSAEHRAWREQVVMLAGRRCEAVEHGLRCSKAEPHHRMFADHKLERRDGGALLDLANGQCLCGRHHTIKTLAARQQRARA